jgi:site-specific recombinase XerD
MSLSVEIENIGGFIRTNKIPILEKGLNRVRAPNATGKTSLIKGIELLVLSEDELRGKGHYSNLFAGAEEPIRIKLTGDIEHERIFRRIGDKDLKELGTMPLITSNGKRSSVCFAIPENPVMQKLLEGKSVKDYVELLAGSERYDKAQAALQEINSDIFSKLEHYRDLLIRLEEMQRQKAENEQDLEVLRKEFIKMPVLDERSIFEDYGEWNKKKRHLEEIDRDIADANSRIQELDNLIETLKDRVKRYDSQIQLLRKKYPRIEARRTELSKELQIKQEDIKKDGYIRQRNAIRPTAPNTQRKQRYLCGHIMTCLHDHGSDLISCTVEELLTFASYASSGKFTKDSRQTMISTLKSLARYINRFHHKIKNLDLLLDDIKGGSPAKNRKEALTLDEWERLINLPMSARDRALLAVMYDGYHRPGEVLLLKWRDLKTNDRGDIEYEITFKTEKTRTIVQKPGTTEILEAWRRECGAQLTDDKPIFPGPDGLPYRTITVLAKMFRRFKEVTGIRKLKPSAIRTSVITHDVEAGLPVSYICLRAWGEPYNDLINLYTKPDSGKIQRYQHDKAGIPSGGAAVLGSSGKFSTREDRIADLELEVQRLSRMADEQAALTREYTRSKKG